MKKLKAPIQIKSSGGGENNVKKPNNTFVSIPPSSAPSIQNQIIGYKESINKIIRNYEETKSDNANKSNKKSNRQKITDLFALIKNIQRYEPPEIMNELKEYSHSKRDEILSNFHKKYPMYLYYPDSNSPSSAPSTQNQINHYKELINNIIHDYEETKSNNENKSKKKNNRQKITDLFAMINKIQVPNPYVNKELFNKSRKNELKKYTRPKRQEILSNFQKKYPINNHISENFDLENFTLGMQLVKEGENLYYEAASEKDPKRKETLYNTAFDIFERSYKNHNNPVACEYISRYYSARTRDEFRHNREIYYIVRIRSWAKDIVSKIPKNEEISKKYLIKVMQILRTIPNKNNLFDSFGINYSSFSSGIKHELYFVHLVSEGTYNRFKLNI